MVYIKPGTSTIRQTAYAQRILGAKGKSKKEIALDVGYSPSIANSVVAHIENKPGFHNAMAKLAMKSGNIALAAMEELQSRGFKNFTNGELTNALNAIGSAWSRFNQGNIQSSKNNNEGNKLRTIILQQVENQTLQSGNEAPKVIESEPVIETTNENL